MKIDRNSPCPCGSGKKFKKCHLGKEDELKFNEPDEISVEVSSQITDLPEVDYGRSRDIVDNLDLKKLTGKETGIKFIDLKKYSSLSYFGSRLPDEGQTGGGSVFVNIYKTRKSDPNNIYIAISPDVGESVLVHQIAHALDYIGGSKLMPGLGKPLSMETDIPVEHLEHPHEFGRWLDYLVKHFDIKLDADDTIISWLYSKDMLIPGEDIQKQDHETLKAKSREMLKFLSENSAELNDLIRERAGYIGSQTKKD